MYFQFEIKTLVQVGYFKIVYRSYCLCREKFLEYPILFFAYGQKFSLIFSLSLSNPFTLYLSPFHSLSLYPSPFHSLSLYPFPFHFLSLYPYPFNSLSLYPSPFLSIPPFTSLSLSLSLSLSPYFSLSLFISLYLFIYLVCPLLRIYGRFRPCFYRKSERICRLNILDLYIIVIHEINMIFIVCFLYVEPIFFEKHFIFMLFIFIFIRPFIYCSIF